MGSTPTFGTMFSFEIKVSYLRLAVARALRKETDNILTTFANQGLPAVFCFVCVIGLGDLAYE